MDRKKKRVSDHKITIWVMRDLTAEPRQYQFAASVLRRGAIVLGAVPALFLLLLIWSLLVKVENRSLSREAQTYNEYLASVTSSCQEELHRAKSRFQGSEQKLELFAQQVDGLEKKTAGLCARTGDLVSRINRDLIILAPTGASGGASGDEDEDADYYEYESRPVVPLSPSQFEKISHLERRLGRLDEQLELYERTLKQLEWTWHERNSLFRAMPSMWPLQEGRITSRFGMRVHPVTRRVQLHRGLDLAAPFGTTIHATADGIVSFVGRRGGYGLVVEIDHGYGISSFYAHCDTTLFEAGEEVKIGQPIARVGTSGLSTGPHLHFEIRVLGEPVDPLEYLSMFSETPEN